MSFEKHHSSKVHTLDMYMENRVILYSVSTSSNHSFATHKSHHVALAIKQCRVSRMVNLWEQRTTPSLNILSEAPLSLIEIIALSHSMQLVTPWIK